MFRDESTVWPRPEPVDPPKPVSASSDGPARLFLALALLTMLMPFSLGAAVSLIRFVAARMGQ